jgi:hypothetical protein
MAFIKVLAKELAFLALNVPRSAETLGRRRLRPIFVSNRVLRF